MKALILPLAIVLTLGLTSAPAAAKKPSKKQLKVNSFVGMLNLWSPSMRKSQSNYLSWADVKTGPTCQEKKIKGPSAFGDSAAKTFATMVMSFKKGPKTEADAAAIQMAQALQDIREATGQASEYYFKRHYKKDDCKLGKKLHPTLTAAWSKYFQNEVVVRRFVVEYNDKLGLEELAKVKKKYGQKIRYHFQKMIVDGKSLIQEVDSQLGSATPDMAKVQESLDAYRTLQLSAVALYDKERAKKKSKIASVLYQGGYNQYVGKYGADFVRSIEQMLKTMSKPAKSNSDKSRRQRDTKSVFDSYNRMVKHGNTVGFSKKVK